MRQSQLFTKTLREAPKDEAAANAKLLIRAGFVAKVIAGVYSYLPLGLRVLNKINSIIREEINKTGAQELHLSVLQNKDIWQRTGRWESARQVMYQFKDDSGKEVGLGWTHEESLAEIAKHYISSYKDLPKALYQIQVKFRNEPRARSGLLRGKEFLMKDLYSFHASDEDLDLYYEAVAKAYGRIFQRIGLETRRTLGSGGLFSKYSDEFQVLTDVGEDTVFYCERCSYAANKDVAQGLGLKAKCPECGGKIIKGRGIEVGNIFKLGTKYSEALDLLFIDKNGAKKPVIMASYGIGIGRLMGTVVEVHHDKQGIIWPRSVAPYQVHLLVLDDKKEEAEAFYQNLQKSGLEVLYDDRDVSAGEKFADADLIGIPYRAVISQKSLLKKAVEIRKRDSTKTKLTKLSNIDALLRYD